MYKGATVMSRDWASSASGQQRSRSRSSSVCLSIIGLFALYIMMWVLAKVGEEYHSNSGATIRYCRDLTALQKRISLYSFQDRVFGCEDGFYLPFSQQLEERCPIRLEKVHAQSMGSIAFNLLAVRSRLNQIYSTMKSKIGKNFAVRRNAPGHRRGAAPPAAAQILLAHALKT